MPRSGLERLREQVEDLLTGPRARHAGPVSLERLHERVLRGDPEARDEVCRRLLAFLHRSFARAASRDGPDVVETAIDDGLLVYCRDPTRYDPAKGSLPAWVTGVVKNLLRTARRTLRRRRRHEVAVDLESTALALVAEQPGMTSAARELSSDLRRRALAFARTAQERAFLEVRLDGGTVAQQATTLGGHDLSPEDQQALVEKVWARVYKRIQRARARRGGEPDE